MMICGSQFSKSMRSLPRVMRVRSSRSSIKRACNFTLRLISCTSSTNSWGIFLAFSQVSRCRKRRRKRSAQFMAQCRKKIILGLARFLRCNFLSLELPATDLVGDVARDFGIAPKRSLVVAQRSEYDFGFKSRSILADAEPLITNVPATSCFAQITLGLASSDVFCGIETGKVLTYNFSRHVAFDLLGSLVPRHDSAVRIEHVNGVFFDAIHKNVELFGCLMQD